MNVDLFCVQPYMEPEDYFTREAFYHKIDRYFLAAQNQRNPGHPAVIVFPEDIATFLLLEGHRDLLQNVSTMNQAFTAIGKNQMAGLLWTMLQYGTLRMKRAFFTRGASRLWNVWHGTMARLAHDYQMTVVAGSALIPESRWRYDSNRFMPHSAKVYNLSFTVGPDGHVLYTTRKVNLVPTQEDVLELTPGPPEAASQTMTLPGTKIEMATAICYDAFCKPHTSQEPKFVNVLDALDQRGARLVAQPSANPWRWQDPWPLDPTQARRPRHQQWDEEGSLASLEKCRRVEIVVNPQLLFDFLDIHFDGQSRILARTPEGVKTLVASQLISGREADMVLHSSWDFSESDAELPDSATS